MGAVLFTVNLRNLANFYKRVVGMRVVSTRNDHIVLETGTFHLTVHQIPKQHAKNIEIKVPPVVRQNTAIKLSFRVGSIGRSRQIAARFGGLIDGPERPGAEECIRYDIPAFRLDGRLLVAFGAAANHCAFYPGAHPIAVHKDELKAYVTRKGTVQFQADTPLPSALARQLVKSRIAEHKAKQRGESVGEKRRR
jgi:uncharacterized protein YdhG (YjbR/CyaY superfamily)